MANKVNQAFIDAQNLHLGTTKAMSPWKVDLKRFRVYLDKKYNVKLAYYFLGSYDASFTDLYNAIQAAGFILTFREHSSKMIGRKKGNVDTDIVFYIMRELYKDGDLDKVVLVSGDGDYWRMVDFLIKEDKLLKILFPNRSSASSLYRRLHPQYFDYLDADAVKKKIEFVI